MLYYPALKIRLPFFAISERPGMFSSRISSGGRHYCNVANFGCCPLSLTRSLRLLLGA
jgi:hypothetical protein